MSDPKEYVVGFGNNNKAFCYLVEAGTKEIGDIRGATLSVAMVGVKTTKTLKLGNMKTEILVIKC